MARGFTQQEGLDYFETFDPVTKMTTIKIILALVAAHNCFLHRKDVTNAFLHNDLNEEVYMRLPHGLSQLSTHPAFYQGNMVCKLLISLYGLKQAPRQWYLKFQKH